MVTITAFGNGRFQTKVSGSKSVAALLEERGIDVINYRSRKLVDEAIVLVGSDVVGPT